MQAVIDCVLSIIEETLYEMDIPVNINTGFGNASISGEYITMYIRFDCSEIFGSTVSIANIAMDESIQCNGIFTILMENIACIDILDSIIISSVSSPAMLDWCCKNNCSFIGNGNYKYK